MKLNSEQIRNPKRTSAGIGTVDGLIVAAIACWALHWSYGEIKETYFTQMSDQEAISLAQEVISMAQAAKSAGLDFIDESSVHNTLMKVSSGTTVISGTFAGQYFGLPLLKENDQKLVAKHLTIRNGQLSLNDKRSFWFD